MSDPGSIRLEQAYALGKMLDNSSWWRDEPKLPRGSTPSDTDYPMIPLLFDNDGKILLCELSYDKAEWRELSKGTRWKYESLVHHTHNFAVLCRHNVKAETGRLINTRYDVQSFQVMVWTLDMPTAARRQRQWSLAEIRTRIL